MRGLKASLLLAGTGAAALAIAMTAAQPQPANRSVFTADQATIGATAYATACARCHQPDLRGSIDAPPLTARISSTPGAAAPPPISTPRSSPRCPSTIPARCPSRRHQHRRVHPAPERCDGGHAAICRTPPFPSVRSRPARRLRTARRRHRTGRHARCAPARAREPQPRRQHPRHHAGHRCDAAQSQSAADWLMIRGNYQAQSHSELRQVTKDNVDDLNLAWVWSMYDGRQRERADAARA